MVPATLSLFQKDDFAVVRSPKTAGAGRPAQSPAQVGKAAETHQTGVSQEL
jgi:hypothetical protein